MMKLNVRTKLLGLSAILIAFMVAVGLISVVNLGAVNDAGQAMYANDVVALGEMSLVTTDLPELQRMVVRGIAYIDKADVQTSVDAKIAAFKADIQKQMDLFRASDLDAEEQARLTAFDNGLPAYFAMIAPVRAATIAGDRTAALAANDAALAAYDAVNGDANALQTLEAEAAKSSAAKIDDTFESGRTLTILLVAAAALVGFLIAFLLARRVVRGVTDVQTALTSLAERCATWLADGMTKLAANDLTYEIAPVTPLIDHYGSDEIGQTAVRTNQLRNQVVAAIEAYNTARRNLADTITEVKSASEAVARTSGQLDQAANQTGAATQQIAQTISQVAAGAADQARAASETSAATQELGSVIAEVARGAAETSASVQVSVAAVDRMRQAISDSDAAAAETEPLNVRTAHALEQGANAVRETVAGMARIKTAVEASAVKVTELGAKGEQIGAIVETINDIAEQTNLLALNAAIEAARAGEQGKGFAVVADEVRKLAERSGRATKEIASLIAEVQSGTKDAVAAMQSGAAEVESGSELASRSGAALDEIAVSSAARNQGIERVWVAIAAIRDASAEANTATEGIDRVVRLTTDAAAQMTANASQVGRSVESIAAVSEENSAAAEEVSAATEEMSAQGEEVVASAQSLTEMAVRLDDIVARFRLPDAASAPSDSVVQRRRSADWTRQVA
jgi:methyl-accepting chemotaxis protein